MARKITLGVMQGRLSNKRNRPLQSFPWSSWRAEFARAANLGLSSIEWLLDGEADAKNPIASRNGRKEIKALGHDNDVAILSLCAHTFIDGALLDRGTRGEVAKSHLMRVQEWAFEAEIQYIVLPLMDSMSISSNTARETFMAVIAKVLTENGPGILLESDMSAAEHEKFLTDMNSERLGVLYDLGNATALGFDIASDLKRMSPYLKEVHIKDREKSLGPSKRLGDGDTLFDDAANVLAELSWQGQVVMETPIFEDWHLEAAHNVQFSRNWCRLVGAEK